MPATTAPTSAPALARRFGVLVALVLVVGTAGCAATSTKTAGAVKLGHGKVDLPSVTLQVGDQNQFLETSFAASGALAGAPYKVSFNQFTDGPHMNAAFSANRIDVGYLGDTPSLYANAAKAGVVVVSGGKLGSGAAYKLLVRPGLTIKSIADLKGKRVGFTRRTALEGWAVNLLKTANLTERDIHVVDLPILSLVNAVSSGQADVVVGTEPGASTYLADHPEGQASVPDEPVYLVVLAKTSSLGDPSKEAALEDLTARLARAENWVSAHPEQFIQAYYVGVRHVPPALGQKLYASAGRIQLAPVAGSGLQHALEAQHDAFVSLEELPADPPVKALFDATVTQRFDAAVQKGLAAAGGGT